MTFRYGSNDMYVGERTRRVIRMERGWGGVVDGCLDNLWTINI